MIPAGNAHILLAASSLAVASKILCDKMSGRNDSVMCSSQGPVELPYPFPALVTRCLLIIYYVMVIFFGLVLNSAVLFLVSYGIQIVVVD